MTYNAATQWLPHVLKRGPGHDAVRAPGLGSKIRLRLGSCSLFPLTWRAVPQPNAPPQIPSSCSASEESDADRHQARGRETKAEAQGWPGAGLDLGLSRAESRMAPRPDTAMSPGVYTLIPCPEGLARIWWGSGHPVELWGEPGATQGRRGNSQPFRFLYLLQSHPHAVTKDLRSLKLNALKREWW